MEWNLNSFDPNLKFVSDLKEDLKTKYYEQHERAKKALEEFSVSLKNIYCDHQRLLVERVELSITNERLQQIINKRESGKEQFTIDTKPYSEVLGASPNCRLEVKSKSPSLVKVIDFNVKDNELEAEKENINEIVPIYSEDFDFDMEKEFAEKHKSPPASLAGSPAKIQASPVLSKRKRGNNSKKNNSSTSNTSSHSISSNGSKNNTSQYATCGNILEVIEIDKDLEKEFGKEITQEPLKAIENTMQSEPKVPIVNESYNIFDISKTRYGNTEFTEKGKKLRQTKLSLKKIAPVIDISKVELDESFNGQSSTFQKDSSWSESFFDSHSISQYNSSKVKKQDHKISPKSEDTSKDDEMIETSFVFNKNSSKLRNKLSTNKRSDINRNKKVDKIFDKPQRTQSDESIFSEGEIKFKKKDNREIDLTEHEDDICETPPLKRKLLNSFDIIPGRTQESPELAYKEVGVRKKDERAKLPGQKCRTCDAWYCDLPEGEANHRVDKCSRHRGKFQFDKLTPDSFWDPTFGDGGESSIFYEN